MSNKPFVYQDPFPLKKDDTEYYLLSVITSPSPNLPARKS
jgi:hypothetical protein